MSKSVAGRMFTVISAVAAVLTANGAHAAEVSGGLVTHVGVQGDVAYFKFAGMPANCLYGVVYIDWNFSPDTAARSRALSLVTSAYLSGKSLSAVGYIQDSAGACHSNKISF